MVNTAVQLREPGEDDGEPESLFDGERIPHGWLVRHACGELAAVWDYNDDGRNLMLECSCGVAGESLARDLGISTDLLHPCERGELCERPTEWPEDG